MTWKRLFLAILVPVALAVTCLDAAVTLRYSSDASARLTPDARQTIERIAAATEVEVRRHLPGLARDLVLSVEVGSNVIDQTGETGLAVSSGIIRWTVNPVRPEGATAIAVSHLRSTLLHESHHLVRGWVLEGRVPSTSFMDAVVAEGLATAFARDTTGTTDPWGAYPKDVAAWVKELMALPNTGATWSRYNEWMFRHPDGRQWIGYRAGTYIADRAMNNIQEVSGSVGHGADT